MECLHFGLVGFLKLLIIDSYNQYWCFLSVCIYIFQPFFFLYPFYCIESEQGIFEEVLHGELDFSTDPWPSISEGAKNLVRKMLVRDPRRRISAHDVLCESLSLSFFHF